MSDITYDTKLRMTVTATWSCWHIFKDTEKYLCGVKSKDGHGYFPYSVNEVGRGGVCSKCIKKLDKIIENNEPLIKANIK